MAEQQLNAAKVNILMPLAMRNYTRFAVDWSKMVVATKNGKYKTEKCCNEEMCKDHNSSLGIVDAGPTAILSLIK